MLTSLWKLAKASFWQLQMAEVQMPAVARLAMAKISIGPTLEKNVSYWQRYPRFLLSLGNSKAFYLASVSLSSTLVWHQIL